MTTKLLLIAAALSLSACSATDTYGIKFMNKSPRGISIKNVLKEERVKAYRSAEKHCAKYYKVTRMLKSIEQEQEDELAAAKSTMVFECLKPSN